MFSGLSEVASDRNADAEQPGGADVASGFCHAGIVRQQEGAAQEDVLHVSCESSP